MSASTAPPTRLRRPSAMRRPEPPLRVVVGRFDDVPSAERALADLREGGVPESTTRIAACGVRTGSDLGDGAGYVEALRTGVAAGAVFGLFFGAIWAAFGMAGDGGAAMLWGALLGGLAGSAAALLGRWWDRRSPEHGVLEADCFDVLVDEPQVERARAVID